MKCLLEGIVQSAPSLSDQPSLKTSLKYRVYLIMIVAYSEVYTSKKKFKKYFSKELLLLNQTALFNWTGVGKTLIGFLEWW